jgi:hypothetical protein
MTQFNARTSLGQIENYNCDLLLLYSTFKSKIIDHNNMSDM